MERKNYDDESLWNFDEDEAINRRRDPLRGTLGDDTAAFEVGGDFESSRWNNADTTPGASRILRGRRSAAEKEFLEKTDFERENS